MIEVKAYQCEHCTKHRKGTGKPIRISRYKDVIYYHEHGCHYNPDNKTCLTCLKGQYNQSDDGIDYPDCEGYFYPGEQIGESKYFGSQWIRIGCPHWGVEKEVEQDVSNDERTD